MNVTRRLKNLPSSEDVEFWGDAEQYNSTPIKIGICEDHTKTTWFKHEGYESDNNGGIICTRCPWGTKLPGYMRLLDGKIIDLRTLNSQ